MDANLVATLQEEERLILDELRRSMSYRRLEEIQEVLSLYGQQPPVGAALDAMLEHQEPPRQRRGAPVMPVIALGPEPWAAEVA
jgi:hypothetical protein